MAGRPRAQQPPEAVQRMQQDMHKGDAAKELFENPVLREALEALEEKYVATWMDTAPDDVAARERLYMAVTVAREFTRHLRTMIGNGTLGRDHLIKLRDGK